MQQVDKQEFAEVWGAAWSMYGKSVSPQLLSIAFEALRAYSIEEVRIGLTRHIQSPDTGQFFPKPADVIKHIDGNSGSRAMVAWTKVEKAVRQVGAWTSVMFDDPLIHRVISDMGGWVELCKVDDRESPFQQKEFLKRYQTYLLREEIGEYPKLLQGIADHQNQQKGFDMQAPVAVGNSSKAAQVYTRGIADFRAIPLKRINPKIIQMFPRNKLEDKNEND
ncbi:DUF6475 domain-containing protein [Marinomonas pollencensis]|uniref:DUF6475 domain-containing protein n=1 Tax=Marinomonas pollencensis TaxID=491954 RepID=A0A3E0DVE7_9GAMM|nr:DUF6475 domain-containing protein [Marinomonas pollencensis]REG85619.1 hypothetical protein DFP81_102152 [Marinomonas pollencensis]